MKKWVKWLGTVGLVLVSSIVLNLALPIAKTPINNFLGHIGVKSEFTIGLAGVAYAAAPDYTATGTADSTPVQNALNALPSTGGKIIIYGGNYTFTATVSRAINNVTIEGSGKSTYLAYDASHALFSAGSQTGWVFKDFRTDIGFITVSSAGDTLLSKLWDNTSLIDAVVPSGTTLPSNPVTGQMFLHIPVGRNILYQYDGAWIPINNHGTIVTYVDPVNGVDDLAHGSASGASAFKTIQFAWTMLPPVIDTSALVAGTNDAVQIYVATGTDTENLLIYGPPSFAQKSTNNAQVNIIGALSSVATKTATGGTQGSGTTVPSITGTFTAHQYEGQLVKFTSGSNNNTYRVVGYSTTTTLYLNGQALPAAPVNNDTYTVYDWGTKVAGWVDINCGVQRLAFTNMEFDVTDNGGYGVQNWSDVYTSWTQCKFYNNNQTGITFASAQGSLAALYNIYCLVVGAKTGFSAENIGQVEIHGGKIKGDGTSLYPTGLQAIRGGVMVGDTVEVSGFWANEYAQQNGVMYNWSSPCSFIHGSTSEGYGILVQHSGMADYTGAGTYVVYAKQLDNTTADANGSGGNTSADAASYSWIGP